MAAHHGPKEIVLRVPAQLVRQFSGISIDASGSVVKIVYRSKGDAQEANNCRGSELGHLHLVSFPLAAFNDALDYVRDNAELSSDENRTIHTTGIGCTNRAKTISAKLDVKLNQLMEFDCFTKSFVYLCSHLSRSELLEPIDETLAAEPIEEVKSQLLAFHSTKDANATQGVDESRISAMIQKMTLAAFGRSTNVSVVAPDAPLTETEDNVLPCMLAVLGSGFVFHRVEKNGTAKSISGSYRGGKAFVGLGKLLTKCQNFDELMTLASEGDNRAVDFYSNDSQEISETEDGEVDSTFYSRINVSTPTLFYCFGKAADSDPNTQDFRREDVARALLHYTVNDLVQTALKTANMSGLHRVFFCGGFCDHPLVREVITTECVRYNAFMLALGGAEKVIQFDFVRPGSFLGALGCAVHEINGKQSVANGL